MLVVPSPFIPNFKSKEYICTVDSRLVCNLQQYLHFKAKTSKNQDKIPGRGIYSFLFYCMR
ncbi:hypothetical protein CXB51_019922 [Gossypium anomalum]|uniref:Uncharacterized protein n=1 Tax=Gossypium anomalum TaxID=47600 RepID=A0A8J6CY18_9ROSI|nr:hypothetical protein CXB51_019922 [Gossypium anomalum]